MDIRKPIEAYTELRDLEAQLVVVYEMKEDSEARMTATDPFPTDIDWSRAATEYAFASADLNRIAARIRVLKGRVHFYAQMV